MGIEGSFRINCFYVIHLLLLCNDYLNDSDFLSLFFELFTGYEAIMVIILSKIRVVKVGLSSYDEI